MPDPVPVRCLECGADHWHLHPTPHSGMSAACATCDTVMVGHEDPGLSRTEVADILRVTPRTVTRWRTQGRLLPVTTAGGGVRYRAADVRALVRAPGDACARGYECAKYPGLADLLGHDQQGHNVIRALIAAHITTRAQLAEAELRDVRGLGEVRVALIHRRLGEVAADESEVRR
jgi:DNA-binding transcriptional MerR regulator